MEFRDLTIAIYDISEYSYLLVGLYALWKSWTTKKYCWLTTFFLSTGLIRTASVFMADEELNTMYLYHLIGFLELLFAYVIYRKYIQKWWSTFVIGIALFYLSNSLFFTSIFEANSVGLTFIQLVVLLFGLNYLFLLYRSGDEENLSKSAFFFFNAGFMIYAAGSFFVNLMSSKIVSASTNDFFNNAWIIEAFVAMIRLLCFSFGLYLVKRER